MFLLSKAKENNEGKGIQTGLSSPISNTVKRTGIYIQSKHHKISLGHAKSFNNNTSFYIILGTSQLTWTKLSINNGAWIKQIAKP